MQCQNVHWQFLTQLVTKKSINVYQKRVRLENATKKVSLQSDSEATLRTPQIQIHRHYRNILKILGRGMQHAEVVPMTVDCVSLVGP